MGHQGLQTRNAPAPHGLLSHFTGGAVHIGRLLSLSLEVENLTTEEKTYVQPGSLRQLVLDGKPPDAEMFCGAMAGMFPNAKGGAIQPWLEFVDEITQSGQYVDFQEEPDLETAKAHWYDTLLASFYQLKAKYGEPSATKTLELGLKPLCLYPYELEEATVQLSQGTSPEKLEQMMRDGLLESETAQFPKLRDVLEADAPAQIPRMNMNY